MTDVTQLPAYIQLRYKENGVFGEMESSFSSSVSKMGDQARREFGEIDRYIKQAVASGGEGARLDLGVGELRAAEAAHERNAAAARQTAQAMRQASAASDEHGASLMRDAASADRMAQKEAALAQAIREKANALDLAQRELDQMAKAQEAASDGVTRFGAANDNLSRSSRQMRAGLGMANQQLVDIGVQLQAGQRASTAFSQQIPQLGFALSGLAESSNATTARIGRFATVLSGPLGLAVGLAAGSLLDMAMRTDEAADAADRASAAHDSFADAQSLLSQAIDLATGKLATQNVVLRESIELTARKRILEGQQAEREALKNLGTGGIIRARVTAPAAALIGSPSSMLDGSPALRRARELSNAAKPLADAVDRFRSGDVDFADTIAAVDRLGDAGKRAGLDLLELKEQIIAVGTARNDQEANQLVIDALEGRGIDQRLRKPGPKPSKPKVDRSGERAAREADRLQEASNKAAEAVLRISEAYDDQPKFVDKVAQSLRKLEDVRSDLYSRKNIGPDGQSLVPGAAEIEADIARVEAQVRGAVSRQIDLFAEATDDRLGMLRLEAAGLYEQANIRREIAAIDDQLGLSKRAEQLEEERTTLAAILTDETLTAEKRTETEAVIARTNAELAETQAHQARIADEAERRVQEERALQREAARTQELLAAQMAVLDTARGGMMDLLSGRSTDLLGDLQQSLQDLQGARLFDDLFRGVFDGIEDELSNSPIARANRAFATQADQTSSSAGLLGRAFDRLTATVDATAQAQGAPPLPGLPPVANDNFLTVTGNRFQETEIGRQSIAEVADRIAGGIVGPLLTGIDETLGTKFSMQLSGVLSGVLAGYIRGGKPGAVLGGLGGLNDQYGADLFGEALSGKIASGLGAALGGAQQGTQIAALSNALGLGGSSTGAQLGGALGSVFGPVGSLAGALGGNFLGSLFGGIKTGSAIIGGRGSDLSVIGYRGSSSGARDTAGDLGSSVNEAVARIAEQLGAQVNASAGRVSIGVRKDEFRVDPQGRGVTNMGRYSDVLNFGDDAEAAVRAAVLDLINDGVISGLSAAESRLLQQGSDIEAALRDVLDFRSVFDRLKEYRDPVGAAVDRLDDEFHRLRTLFEKAGASAAEYADLEELYGLERARAIEEAQERVVGSLRALLDDLTIGDSGLSLRTRRANAMGDYQELAARVEAGDTGAYDDFAEAARALLDIERQLFGSTEAYFDRLDEITALTRSRVEGEVNVEPLTPRGSPQDTFDPSLNISASLDTGFGEANSFLRNMDRTLVSVDQSLADIRLAMGNGRAPLILRSSNF